MQELWQSFQLGWELFQHVNTPRLEALFNPIAGSISSRLKLLQLQLDFGAIEQIKSLAPQDMIARIQELKSYLGAQLLALMGQPAAMAFALGFDLSMLSVVRANILRDIPEPVAAVGKALEQELDRLNINPQLVGPIVARLGDLSVPEAEFTQLMGRTVENLKVRLTDPRDSRERVFVAMPFDESHRSTLEAIRRAASYAGYYVTERADDAAYTGRLIPEVIRRGIDEAALVVVDLSGGRPNVYFEAGYADGKGKDPMYIARKGTVVAFDVDHYPILWFESAEDLVEGLTRRLQKRTAAVGQAAGA